MGPNCQPKSSGPRLIRQNKGLGRGSWPPSRPNPPSPDQKWNPEGGEGSLGLSMLGVGEAGSL